ncbi:MAG: hypothetical protein HY763_09770 [Planctomycetes bacterium]|nr:hypothetical protein [Planctomycetota bacterium]
MRFALTGADRLSYEYPDLGDVDPLIPGHIVVDTIDKQRLLAILTTLLPCPWTSTQEFVVMWSPSAVSAGTLRIESTRPRSAGLPSHPYDEIPLGIAPGDPQWITVFLR